MIFVGPPLAFIHRQMMQEGTKMKIAIISDAWKPQVNGVVHTMEHVKEELENEGHEIVMIVPGGEGARTLPCPTYPEIRLALRPVSLVRRALQRHRPEAIHIATEGPLGLAARRYCRQRGLPYTTAYHTEFPEYVHRRLPLVPASAGYRFIRWFHGRAAATLVTTETMRGKLASRGLDPRRLIVWSRGVDAELFRPKALDPALRDEGKKVLLYFGRVSVEKNIEAFLELEPAFAHEKWVIGDGPAREDLQARFPQARWFGMKRGRELADLVAQADVFVFPSKSDTFGIVMLEANACGAPVAAYPVQGPIDVIKNGENGWMDEDLGVAVERALEVDRGKCRAEAMRHTWSACAETFLNTLATAEDARRKPCGDGALAVSRPAGIFQRPIKSS